MTTLEIDDSAILGVIKKARRPLTFLQLEVALEVPLSMSRLLDRQLQRLRRAGIIRFQKKTDPGGRGWRLAGPAAPTSSKPEVKP